MSKENLVNVILELYNEQNCFLDDFFYDSEERKQAISRLSEDELKGFLHTLLEYDLEIKKQGLKNE